MSGGLFDGPTLPEEREPVKTTAVKCHHCQLVHPVYDPKTDPESRANIACVMAHAAVMTALLKQVGDPGHCRGCGMEIIWVTHKNGKKTPYTPEGLNHFIDCQKVELFR